MQRLRYRGAMSTLPSPPAREPVGSLLRTWRQRRRLSQLDLASQANISTRHLSYVETGRAEPSRAMLMHLAERLQVPLRERNGLLSAAGYAPVYRERPLSDPALHHTREAVERVLRAHEPCPALALNRHWEMLAHNASVPPLLLGVAAHLLQGPVNVLRLCLHPDGLAPRIANLSEWRGHLLARLRQQIDISADPVLVELLSELQSYPGGAEDAGVDAHPVAVPLQLRTPGGVLSFISTTTVFGTPFEITLSELALEAFFPADDATAALLRG